ncbi:TetR/AcrR family transcriptional regulator [Actinomycetospora termitidis]|uniref:TetR/AcrR family transcriptional regulator n=1 Tax=Actinomycetospora termitidis TaxID=3053470 RepID=A0ABT7MGD7_9PSEU|nr:TetR/AcrR family transcriptional regulator [Actinomycetospora sp. Odt1-22]MDL5159735.1 TetR/AcrR family transcriptional regulator [Actinomycetospora sp. Odt1-22]
MPTKDEVTLTPGARRILDVAATLFYERGIHAVGVDTIAAESGVTKRTLYDRFGSKDALVLAYLAERDRRWRDRLDAALDAAPSDPLSRVDAVFEVLAQWTADSGRGCSFVNATAEIPDPDHPARRLVREEKRWLRERFEWILADGSVPDASARAATLLLLHEGAFVVLSAGQDPDAVPAARRAARALVQEAVESP